MFFSKPVKHKLIMLLELQSSLVRGSLVLTHESDAPQVLFTQSSEIPYKPNATSAYYVKTAMRSIREMTDIAERNLYSISHSEGQSRIPHHIGEVHYVLSSPWVISQARTVSASFDKDTAITEERLAGILSEEREKIAVDKHLAVETIEEKIFDVRLNGYSLTAWKGKPARELEISYALSVGSAESMRELRTLASQAARSRDVHFHSSLLLQYVSLRSAIQPDGSYSLIHVHGELTDLVVVKRGTCSFFGSFPIGINTLLRKIGEVTNTDRQTADSLMSLYLGNHIEESNEKKVGLVISNMAGSWTGALERLWSDSNLTEALPGNVYIIARAHEDFFAKSFRSVHPQAKIGKLAVDMTSTYALAIHSIGK